MSESKKRVCIIGAGPAGMSALYHLKLLAGDSVDVQCYEKTSTWRGLWNYTWRTGTDEYGETVPSCMYYNLWTIGPKEYMEARDYSFEEHFCREIPSYIPRELYAQYLDGRWTKGKCGDMTGLVNFRHVVLDVDYRPETDDFKVIIRDLCGEKDKTEIFSHVIVAIGTFNSPNIPDFPGIDTFPGRILHSKDFRHALEYKGKSVLIIGGKFSATEIALQLIKFGSSSHVVVSSRNAALEIKVVPKDIDLRLLPERIDKNNVIFKDGTSGSFDVIIMCTGYNHHYPFLHGNLRFDLEGKRQSVYPPNLYKGIVWLKGGNYKLLHMGSFFSFYNFTVLDVQAIWIAKYILQKILQSPLSYEDMKKDSDEWRARANAITHPSENIGFMRDIGKYICMDIGYETKYLDKAHDIVEEVLKGRLSDVCGYRDECFPNLYTGKVAPVHHTKWIDCLDESLDLYFK